MGASMYQPWGRYFLINIPPPPAPQPLYSLLCLFLFSKLLCFCPLVLSSFPSLLHLSFSYYNTSLPVLVHPFLPPLISIPVISFLPLCCFFPSFIFHFSIFTPVSFLICSTLIFCFFFLLFTAISFSLVHYVPNKCLCSCPSLNCYYYLPVFSLSSSSLFSSMQYRRYIILYHSNLSHTFFQP